MSGTGYVLLKQKVFAKKQNKDSDLVVYENSEKKFNIDTYDVKTRRRLSSIHL